MEEGGQNKKFKLENQDGGGNASNNNNSNDVPLKSRRVYVANVPFDVKWSELKDLFREKVGDVTYCTIFENEDGKSRGCGLVEFADPQVARKAIEMMHRTEFKSRELVVKEDLDCERDRFGRIINQHGNNRSRDDSQRRDGGNNDRGSGGNRDRGNRQNQQMIQNTSYGFDHSVMSNTFAPPQQHNTFGLSQQFLDSLSISLPLNNRIFVANLEYKVDQKKLEEIFKLAGRVSRVNLVYDNVTKSSKGYATITFEHPVEAVQAISMFNNQKLYGRTMSVRMDKYECEDDLDQLPTKLPVGLESIGKGLGVGGNPLNVAKSIMNAAVIAPPHLTVPGQTMTHPQMHSQAVQQPAAMQQAVIAAQMQQLQQQQQQHAGPMPQTLQPTLTPTMQHQLQQSLQQPMQQQYQIHQLAQPQQQPMQQQGVPSMAYQTIQQLQASNAIRVPQAANVYQQPQQPTQQSPVQAQQQPTAQIQQPQQQHQQQPQQQQQTPTSAPTTNLSVYSTFERQFREASAPQGFTRN